MGGCSMISRHTRNDSCSRTRRVLLSGDASQYARSRESLLLPLQSTGSGAAAGREVLQGLLGGTSPTPAAPAVAAASAALPSVAGIKRGGDGAAASGDHHKGVPKPAGSLAAAAGPLAAVGAHGLTGACSALLERAEGTRLPHQAGSAVALKGAAPGATDTGARRRRGRSACTATVAAVVGDRLIGTQLSPDGGSGASASDSAAGGASLPCDPVAGCPANASAVKYGIRPGLAAARPAACMYLLPRGVAGGSASLNHEWRLPLLLQCLPPGLGLGLLRCGLPLAHSGLAAAAMLLLPRLSLLLQQLQTSLLQQARSFTAAAAAATAAAAAALLACNFRARLLQQLQAPAEQRSVHSAARPPRLSLLALRLRLRLPAARAPAGLRGLPTWCVGAGLSTCTCCPSGWPARAGGSSCMFVMPLQALQQRLTTAVVA